MGKNKHHPSLSLSLSLCVCLQSSTDQLEQLQQKILGAHEKTYQETQEHFRNQEALQRALQHTLEEQAQQQQKVYIHTHMHNAKSSSSLCYRASNVGWSIVRNYQLEFHLRNGKSCEVNFLL